MSYSRKTEILEKLLKLPHVDDCCTDHSVLVRNTHGLSKSEVIISKRLYIIVGRRVIQIKKNKMSNLRLNLIIDQLSPSSSVSICP